MNSTNFDLKQTPKTPSHGPKGSSSGRLALGSVTQIVLVIAETGTDVCQNPP